jgi:hypothetical protein
VVADPHEHSATFVVGELFGENEFFSEVFHEGVINTEGALQEAISDTTFLLQSRDY